MAVVGPTASGKSALALRIARAARSAGVGDVELVCVDAMTVYRGLDIGTAKPTASERAEFIHHGLDLAEVEQPVTMVDVADACRAALDDIARRGAAAVIVGGTGLHLRAVIDGLDPPGSWPELRAELEALAARGSSALAALYEELQASDPIAAERIDPANARRIVRALEVCRGSGRPFTSFGPGLGEYRIDSVRQLAISWSREQLGVRIAQRIAGQVEAGWLPEVEAMWPRLGPTAVQVIGYRELHEHLTGGRSLDDALGAVVLRTRQFAVRQERWFRRDPRITWYSPDDGESAVASVIEAWSDPGAGNAGH
ncbi:MAG: tRNA (adenosine(37)-N6)-dimethylallyltransferase MiaA [Acidimicrobiia bacterium]